MNARKPLLRGSLANNIVLLVALMGVIAAAAVGHVLSTTRSIERGYRLLVEGKAQSVLLIDDVLLDISESAQLAHAMRASRQAQARSDHLADLLSLQAQIDEKLVRLRQRNPDHSMAIDSALRHAGVMMTVVQEIAKADAAGRAGQASLLLDRAFATALAELRRALETLLDEITRELDGAAARLSSSAQSAARVATAGAAAGLSVGVLLAAYFARHRLSVPLRQLTQVIGEVSQGNYDKPIAAIYRRDEIGTIARALRVFRENWQRTERLAREAAEGELARRLSDQLTEVTQGIPGAVFQCHITSEGQCELRMLSQRASVLPPARATLPRTIEHWIGNSLAAMLDDPDSPGRTRLARCAAALEDVSFDTAVEQDGQTRWFRTMATARPAPEGGALFNGVAFDVTEIKSQARALMLARQAAEAITREKSDLLSVMSHEIRTPLNAILGMAQLAAKDAGDAQQRDQVAQILASGQHLRGVIDGILAHEQLPATRSSSAKGPDLHGLRVLVVEDNALNQLVIRGLLEAYGMQVDTADNGQVAFDTLVAAPDDTYAAVLMDLQMPVMDGVTATRKLRELSRFSRLPIIAVTASVTRDDIESAREAGIDDYIAKPIADAALRSALQHWIVRLEESRPPLDAGSGSGA